MVCFIFMWTQSIFNTVDLGFSSKCQLKAQQRSMQLGRAELSLTALWTIYGTIWGTQTTWTLSTLTNATISKFNLHIFKKEKRKKKIAFSKWSQSRALEGSRKLNKDSRLTFLYAGRTLSVSTICRCRHLSKSDFRISQQKNSHLHLNNSIRYE